MKTIATLSIAAVILAATATVEAGYVDTGAYTVEPDGWAVGDLNSTHMIYDSLLFPTPDVNITNPTGLPTPTQMPFSPGYTTGSNNYYSFSGNYLAQADIYNHNTGGTDGTHVIVQTTATTNEGVSVLPGTLEIVDHSGAAITGGANGDALVDAALVASGPAVSSIGAAHVDVLLWEFFLPNYTGDFRVQWGESVHSGFDQIRVDSMIAPAAYAATQFTTARIPEPSSVALASLVGLGSLVVTLRKRWG